MKKIIFLITFLLAIAVVILSARSTSSQKVEPNEAQAVSNPSPTPLNELVGADSGDGKFTLTEIRRKAGDGNMAYSFKVIDHDKKTELILFEQTVSIDTSMEVPFNSWSSDNKQVFIQVNRPNEKTYYVFHADGSLYSNNEKYLDVIGYWKESKSLLSLREATGWAGPDLLIIYTSQEDGTSGQPFWFVTGTRKFLGLSH